MLDELHIDKLCEFLGTPLADCMRIDVVFDGIFSTSGSSLPGDLGIFNGRALHERAREAIAE